NESAETVATKLEAGWAEALNQRRSSNLPRNGHDAPTERPPDDGSPGEDFANYFERETVTHDGESTLVMVGLPFHALSTNLLQRTGGWPKLVRPMHCADGPKHEPLWLANADDLFAWIGGRLRHQRGNSIRWAGGADKVSKAEFCGYLRQSVDDFDSVEA